MIKINELCYNFLYYYTYIVYYSSASIYFFNYILDVMGGAIVSNNKDHRWFIACMGSPRPKKRSF